MRRVHFDASKKGRRYIILKGSSKVFLLEILQILWQREWNLRPLK